MGTGTRVNIEYAAEPNKREGHGWLPIVYEDNEATGHAWWPEGYDRDIALEMAREKAQELAARFVGDWDVHISERRVAFDRAFARLRRTHGGRNLVSLRELREAIGDRFADWEFNDHLVALRRERLYSLSPHEGRSSTLSAEDALAGVNEGGRLLVYAEKHDDPDGQR